MPIQIIDRLEKLDRLIRNKQTGSPEQLAEQLGISERSLFRYLSVMKARGAAIFFSRNIKSYYYGEQGGFSFRFYRQEELADALVSM